jgi:hypothetical protein
VVRSVMAEFCHEWRSQYGAHEPGKTPITRMSKIWMRYGVPCAPTYSPIAAESGTVSNSCIRKSFRKKPGQGIPEQRGAHPGVVRILSAMESCGNYEPWHLDTTAELEGNGAREPKRLNDVPTESPPSPRPDWSAR